MMSRIKKIVILFVSLLALLLLLAVWYKYSYAMDTAESYEVNSVEYSKKLLIATQGSEFKDKITHNVINYFKNDSIFINVIDISALKEIEPADYNVFLLIHTWENWNPPVHIESFINGAKDYKDKIVVITTSGEGSHKMSNIDAITGESKTENILPFTREAIDKIESILN